MKLRCFTASNFPHLRSRIVHKSGQNGVSAHFLLCHTISVALSSVGNKIVLLLTFLIRFHVCRPNSGKNLRSIFRLVSWPLLTIASKANFIVPCLFLHVQFWNTILPTVLQEFRCQGCGENATTFWDSKTAFSGHGQAMRREVGISKPTLKTLSGSRQ